MRLWLLLLASLAMTSAVASADKSNDDINTKVMDHDDDDHHHGGHDGDDDDGEPRIVDRSRACPDGFFYAGEPSSLSDKNQEERWQVWEQGPTSPVYSCYRELHIKPDEPLSFAGASLSCNQMRSQLISINQFLEEDLLKNLAFTEKLQGLQGALYLTSGLNFGDQNWTWFGADEPIAGDLVARWSMNSTNSTNSTNSVQPSQAQCLTLSWEQGELIYTPTSCTGNFIEAICEVRVYTQTWYVWFYVNWLQILFFFTLVSLILASCCLFQTWFSRPDRRQGRVVQGQLNVAPPPYTLTQDTHSQNRARAAAANYARKGRDILAKVTFYNRPNEDKQPLA